MQTRVYLPVLAAWILGALSGLAASYTVTLPAGLSVIAHELDNGIGNKWSQLFPNPGGTRDGDELLIYNCNGSYTLVFLDSSSPSGFSDAAFNPIPDGTLPPGGALLYGNNAGGLLNLTFTGTLPVQVLPAPLPCGCGHLNMFGRQTVGTGTYENITGYPPQNGAQVLRWNGLGFVTNTFAGGAWSLGAPTILRIGEGALFLVPCPEKWEQIPDTSTNGLDVRATNPNILADDFRCTATGPITELRVRGSWLNDNVATQACFCLGIWTDIPRSGTNYSRPGVQLCNWCFSPGQYRYVLYTNGVSEHFYDPNIAGTNGLIGFDTNIWEYIFDVPTNQACIQTNGNIYWLSLTMDCVTTNLFGWKTCPTNFNDDAVYGHVSGTNTPLLDWSELHRPGTSNSLDLSFDVTTSLTNTQPIQTNPPTILTVDKWLQIPDTSTNGLDVRATKPKILADDFECALTGPINHVKLWGSWLDDKVPATTCFCLGFWTDVPVSFTNIYSHPGTQLCYYCFSPGQYTVSPYTNNVFEQFFDPNIPAIIGTDTIIWEYDFDLPYPCWQTNGNTYWLSATANCFDTNQFLFGWKTCPTNWNDDAVFGHIDMTNDVPLGDWVDLKRPPYGYYSLDLAFEIFTQTNLCACTNLPVISCPADIVLTTCGTNVSWSLIATSLCSSVTVTSSPPSGTFFGGDTTNTITAIATDVCGRTNSCTFRVILHRPTLTLSISRGTTPGTVRINWTAGILQQADTVFGPWTDVPSAASPYTVTASASHKFYRLRCP